MSTSFDYFFFTAKDAFLFLSFVRSKQYYFHLFASLVRKMVTFNVSICWGNLLDFSIIIGWAKCNTATKQSLFRNAKVHKITIFMTQSYGFGVIFFKQSTKPCHFCYHVLLEIFRQYSNWHNTIKIAYEVSSRVCHYCILFGIMVFIGILVRCVMVLPFFVCVCIVYIFSFKEYKNIPEKKKFIQQR